MALWLVCRYGSPASVTILMPLAGAGSVLHSFVAAAAGQAVGERRISAGFLVSLPLWFRFNPKADFQFEERAGGFRRSALRARGRGRVRRIADPDDHVGRVPGDLSSWRAIETRLKEYYGHFCCCSSHVGSSRRGICAVFLFWELTLIPMYFIIASGRRAAGLRFDQVRDIHAGR